MKLLIISNPKRTDFYNYLVNTPDSSQECFILWNYSPEEDTVSAAEAKVSGFYYWKDYLTPFHLLDKIKPDKIVFFESIDFWQIPLIIACKRRKIRTFFLEHGIGNDVSFVISRFKEDPSVTEKADLYFSKLKRNFSGIIRNRIFFLSALCSVSGFSSKWKYLMTLVYMKLYTPIHALSKLKIKERTPDYAILFNKNNIDPFLLYNHIDKTHIIADGVPFFDRFYRSTFVEKDHVVFIEHPYLEEKILGWSTGFHERLARTLEAFAVKRKVKAYVKLHPKSDKNIWLSYQLNPEYITILQTEDVTDLLLESRLILSYSSTLLSVMLSCRKNTVLLGWHPEPHIFGMNYFSTGLCHVSFVLEDLEKQFDEWVAHNPCKDNSEKYQAYMQEFNFPFDGKATDRILQAIRTL
jgi:hypothetical protein